MIFLFSRLRQRVGGGGSSCDKHACHVFERDRSDLSGVRAVLVTPPPENSHIAWIFAFVFACLSVLLSLCLTSCFVMSSVCRCLHACCSSDASDWGNRFGRFFFFFAVQFDFPRSTSTVSFWHCNQVCVYTCHLVLSVYDLTVEKIR